MAASSDWQLPFHFFPPQAEVMECGLLNSGMSCVLQMPTGSGKTWLAESAIHQALSNGSRAIYLTPLRALASEMTTRWKAVFRESKIGVFTGDYNHSSYPVPFVEARILVMTPERLDACTRAWRAHWSWLPEVDLVVVDELHLLGDRNRGPRLEGTISRFRRLNPFSRLLGLSATLGNRAELADWLDGIEYASTWRPIPIEWQIIYYQKATEKPELVAATIRRNIEMGGKSLIFVQSRRRAEELSRFFRSLGIQAGHHHAGLCPADRRMVEEGFRNIGYDVLVATSTLEMGLNLPVRQVVLYDLQEFDGTDFRPLATNSVWQRAGRAGRAGFDKEGEAVLLAPSWDQTVHYYFRGDFEPIRSGFADKRYLAEQIITEVSSGLARSLVQLKNIFNQSLAARQQLPLDIDNITAEMCRSGMLEEKPEEEGERVIQRLRATRLGRITVRHMLSPATVLLFNEALNKEMDFTFLDLLIIATSSDDCEPILPVDFEEIDSLAIGLSKEKSRLLQLSRHSLVEFLHINGKRLLAALRMALVARDWTRLSNAELVAERHACYPFEVERICESLSRLLTAMSAILIGTASEEMTTCAIEDFIPLRERVYAIEQMIRSGLDESAVTLTLVRGIGSRIAKKLQLSGIADIDDLASSEPDNLAGVGHLSRTRAEKWVIEARDIIRSRSAFSYREEGLSINFLPAEWPVDVDPYRLRRAIDLNISGIEGGTFRIIGGLEPHTVHTTDSQLICDCLDAPKITSQRQECKHVLAVKLHKGDPKICELVRQLTAANADEKLNLFDLWFNSPRSLEKKFL